MSQDSKRNKGNKGTASSTEVKGQPTPKAPPVPATPKPLQAALTIVRGTTAPKIPLVYKFEGVNDTFKGALSFQGFEAKTLKDYCDSLQRADRIVIAGLSIVGRMTEKKKKGFKKLLAMATTDGKTLESMVATFNNGATIKHNNENLNLAQVSGMCFTIEFKEMIRELGVLEVIAGEQEIYSDANVPYSFSFMSKAPSSQDDFSLTLAYGAFRAATIRGYIAPDDQTSLKIVNFANMIHDCPPVLIDQNKKREVFDALCVKHNQEFYIGLPFDVLTINSSGLRNSDTTQSSQSNSDKQKKANLLHQAIDALKKASTEKEEGEE